jgi:hypothetical protein
VPVTTSRTSFLDTRRRRGKRIDSLVHQSLVVSQLRNQRTKLHAVRRRRVN